MKISDKWQRWEPHGEETRQDPWEGFEEHPDDRFRKWEGSRRVEVLVPVHKILSAVERLFGGKKK